MKKRYTAESYEQDIKRVNLEMAASGSNIIFSSQPDHPDPYCYSYSQLLSGYIDSDGKLVIDTRHEVGDRQMCLLQMERVAKENVGRQHPK